MNLFKIFSKRARIKKYKLRFVEETNNRNQTYYYTTINGKIIPESIRFKRNEGFMIFSFIANRKRLNDNRFGIKYSNELYAYKV